MIETFFDEDLVDIIESDVTQEEYFEHIFKKLKAKNLVEDSFLSAITQRELEFPTGLETPHLDVAIPHTDPEHIKSRFIYMIKTKNPVTFGKMGTMDETIEVNYSFVLGFDKGEDQLVLLQNLMSMFMTQEVMEKLGKAATTEQIFETVSSYF